jgi:hypothetical protein
MEGREPMTGLTVGDFPRLTVFRTNPLCHSKEQLRRTNYQALSADRRYQFVRGQKKCVVIRDGKIIGWKSAGGRR